jgi:hypothetical protein
MVLRTATKDENAPRPRILIIVDARVKSSMCETHGNLS